MALTDSEDDMPQLSSDTLAVLQSFYSERDQQQKRFEELKAAAEEDHERKKLSMDMWAEDWQTSQFWYTDEVSSTLAKQLLKGTTTSSSVAVVSAPSTYVQAHNALMDMKGPKLPTLKLLEFDERFGILQDFVQYDYNQPFKLPPELKGKFDRVVADPPFLSEDCQAKFALTVRWLLDPVAVKEGRARVIVCTGERMSSLIKKFYPDCRPTSFEMVHNKGRLSNEFRCYANFECEDWRWTTSVDDTSDTKP